MLWIDFVNSYARDPVGREPVSDGLADSQWQRQFAEKWQLRPQQLRSLDDRDLLRHLRGLLQRWVKAIVAEEPVSPPDFQSLNQYLNARRVKPTLRQEKGTYQLELVPEASGVDTWLFAVAVSFAEFLVAEDPTRLKLCDNPDCLWVFYDTTRSRTRRWCAVGCGDLIKVREFRRRHKKG